MPPFSKIFWAFFWLILFLESFMLFNILLNTISRLFIILFCPFISFIICLLLFSICFFSLSKRLILFFFILSKSSFVILGSSFNISLKNFSFEELSLKKDISSWGANKGFNGLYILNLDFFFLLVTFFWIWFNSFGFEVALELKLFILLILLLFTFVFIFLELFTSLIISFILSFVLLFIFDLLLFIFVFVFGLNIFLFIAELKVFDLISSLFWGFLSKFELLTEFAFNEFWDNIDNVEVSLFLFVAVLIGFILFFLLLFIKGNFTSFIFFLSFFSFIFILFY